MDLRLNLQDLSDPKQLESLVSAISEIADQMDVLYVDSAPNGVISARVGKIALYKNGSTYETWQNIDGAQLWQRIDQGAVISPLVAGDWIISSVTTARAGWTNKSADYSNKFLRVNATPGGTGGADTHTHIGGAHTHNTPAHDHVLANSGNYAQVAGQQIVQAAAGGAMYSAVGVGGNSVGVTSTTTSGGSGTSGSDGAVATGSGDNVPAYINITIFQKDA